MAKEAFIHDHNFRGTTIHVIHTINRVISNYQSQGYTLTLRQLYYQMIAGDLFPEDWIDTAYNRKNNLDPDTKNTEKNYKRLGEILNMGRLTGYIDWDAIEDRGRNLERVQTWSSPRSIINAARRGFRLDPWDAQPYYIQVYVEKEALASVVERACNPWRVGYMPTKGYMSQSEMYAQAMEFESKINDGKQVVILDARDHDVSGLDMTDDVIRRMLMYLGEDRIEVVRIALNMDQVRTFNPPPNPAKPSDSRYKAYVEQYGEQCWELDAMPPQDLVQLIEDQITYYVDEDAWDATMKEEKVQLAELEAIDRHWSTLSFWMREEGLVVLPKDEDEE